MMNHTQLHGLTAAQLATKVLNHEPIFILDVRNESDFNDWRIEGNQVKLLNKPYFDFIDGVEEVLDLIPDNQEVLVVCSKEGSSKFVAEQLIEAGIHRVSYLIGGMKSWSEHLEPVKIGDLRGGGEIVQFVRIGKGCLSYMVISNGEAAVIDAVRMTDVFADYAQKNNVKIKHTIDTHLHADHISGGRQLAEQAGGTYWLPPKDADEVVFDYEKLDEGKSIVVGNTHIKIQPVYSPGHTIGSTSLIIDDQYLLSGDILFVKSIGRPDLAGKAEDWVSDLRTTLYERYKQLSDDLIVLPAHFGKFTELGEGPEKVLERMKTNEKLVILDVRETEEWESGHIPGAKHIPLGQIARALNEMDPKQETIIICRTGNRSAQACDFLSSMGYNVVNMPGGMMRWPGDIIYGA